MKKLRLVGFGVLAACVLGTGPAGAGEFDKVAEQIKQVMKSRGLPSNWIPAQKVSVKLIEPLAFTAIWHDVQSPRADGNSASQVAQRAWKLVHPPASTLVFSSHSAPKGLGPDGMIKYRVSCTDGRYEEAAHLALFGPNHVHFRPHAKVGTRRRELPLLRPEFVAHGQPNVLEIFSRVAKGQITWVDTAASLHNKSGGVIVSKWFGFAAPAPPWVIQRYRWRARHLLQLVRGRTELPNGDIEGETRFALITSIEVARATSPQPTRIYESPTLAENDYSTGRKEIVYWSRVIRVVMEVPGHPTGHRAPPGPANPNALNREAGMTVLHSSSTRRAIEFHDELARRLASDATRSRVVSYKEKYYR